MLVELSVENFRSIRDRLDLSFIPSTRERLDDRLIHDSSRRYEELLPSLFLYGGNASGKSNICHALTALKWLTLSSASKLNRGDPIPLVVPFRLDPETQSAATTIEIVFSLAGEYWKYLVRYDTHKVHEERLQRKADSPQSRWSLVFSRKGDDRSAWKGNATRITSTFFESVRDNSTVLSKAAAEEITSITPIFDAIRSITVRDMANPPKEVVAQAVESLTERPDMADWLVKVISCADIYVDDLDVEREEVDWADVPEHIRRKFEELSTSADKVEKATLRFLRRDSNDKPVSFDLGDESNGTLRFLALALDIYATLRSGTLLVLDEFDASLHPLLAEVIRDLMNDPDLNSTGAQFLAITHNEGLLDAAHLRRDQIVLVERDEAMSTTCHAMSELNRRPRSDESFRKRYLNGGYGGVPRIGDLRALLLKQLQLSNKDEVEAKS